MRRSVVYAQLLEDIKGKEYARCRIHFIAGSMSGLGMECFVPTAFFTYYNYGFALELVTLDHWNNIVEMCDMTRKDMGEFGISIEPGISYHVSSHSIESRSRFVYKLEDSIMCRKLGKSCINLIENEIRQSTNVGIVMHLIRGALLSVEVLKDVKADSFLFRYAMGDGSKLMNSGTLVTVVPYSSLQDEDTNPMTQEEIDDLLRQLEENNKLTNIR